MSVKKKRDQKVRSRALTWKGQPGMGRGLAETGGRAGGARVVQLPGQVARCWSRGWAWPGKREAGGERGLESPMSLRTRG